MSMRPWFLGVIVLSLLSIGGLLFSQSGYDIGRHVASAPRPTFHQTIGRGTPLQKPRQTIEPFTWNTDLQEPRQTIEPFTWNTDLQELRQTIDPFTWDTDLQEPRQTIDPFTWDTDLHEPRQTIDPFTWDTDLQVPRQTIGPDTWNSPLQEPRQTKGSSTWNTALQKPHQTNERSAWDTPLQKHSQTTGRSRWNTALQKPRQANGRSTWNTALQKHRQTNGRRTWNTVLQKPRQANGRRTWSTPLQKPRHTIVPDMLNSTRQERQQARKALLQLGCELVTLKPQPITRMYVDEARGMLYCFPPKAGCTAWKLALGLVSGKISSSFLEGKMEKRNPGSEVHENQYLRYIGLTRVQFPLPNYTKNYFKLMVVRDPYERIASAYIDKVVLTRRHLFNGMTFDEVIQDIGMYGMPPKEYEPHFDTYYSLCRPCEVQYDYIIKTDSLIEDAGYIFHDILRTNYSTEFLLNSSRGPSSSRAQVSKEYYFEQLSRSSKHILRQYLSPDALLFGYSADRWI